MFAKNLLVAGLAALFVQASPADVGPTCSIVLTPNNGTNIAAAAKVNK